MSQCFKYVWDFVKLQSQLPLATCCWQVEVGSCLRAKSEEEMGKSLQSLQNIHLSKHTAHIRKKPQNQKSSTVQFPIILIQPSKHNQLGEDSCSLFFFYSLKFIFENSIGFFFCNLCYIRCHPQRLSDPFLLLSNQLYVLSLSLIIRNRKNPLKTLHSNLCLSSAPESTRVFNASCATTLNKTDFSQKLWFVTIFLARSETLCIFFLLHVEVFVILSLF